MSYHIMELCHHYGGTHIVNHNQQSVKFEMVTAKQCIKKN